MSFSDRASQCKGPGRDRAWHVGETLRRRRRPECLEQSEQGGEREEGRAGRGLGRSSGACGLERGLGFYPKGGGSPGGLWAEEGRDLSQVFKARLLCKGKDFCPP